MFHQTFQPHDLLIILVLIVLEGVLSIDNALVLALLARRLPQRLQKKALTYGLLGALLLRLITVALASALLRWRWVKLLGGAYLIYIALKHLLFEKEPERVRMGPDGLPISEEQLAQELFHETHGVGIEYEPIESTHSLGFWHAVGVIELTDLAFAIDSILAAIALVGPPPPGWPAGTLHPKLWVVVTGGMLGVFLMRVAAVVFIRLLESFPRFELSAYLLVLVIGLKLIADWWFNAYTERLDFHDPSSVAFWVFWVLMLICFGVGFLPAPQVAKEI
jgi:YkoY family integral membrane protein